MSFRPLLLASTALGLAACEAEVVDRTERRATDVFTFEAPLTAGKTVRLRNMTGSLDVVPSPDGVLRVAADLTWLGDSARPTNVSFSGTPTAEGVLICALFGGGTCTEDDYETKSEGSGFSIGEGGLRLGLGGRKRAAVHLRVQVPAGVRLDIVQVEGNATSASSAPVKIVGVNGNFTVVTSVGPIYAKMVNGSIDARMTTLAGADSVSVTTVNGDAFAFIPENASATVDVSTTNGTLLTDFPALASDNRLSKHITTTLGAGTTPIRVRTLNGGAQLRRLDAQGRAFEISTP